MPQIQPLPINAKIQLLVEVRPQAHDIADPSITKPSYMELVRMSTIDEGTGQVLADPPVLPPVGEEEASTLAELSHLCPNLDD